MPSTGKSFLPQVVVWGSSSMWWLLIVHFHHTRAQQAPGTYPEKLLREAVNLNTFCYLPYGTSQTEGCSLSIQMQSDWLSKWNFRMHFTSLMKISLLPSFTLKRFQSSSYHPIMCRWTTHNTNSKSQSGSSLNLPPLDANRNKPVQLDLYIWY